MYITVEGQKSPNFLIFLLLNCIIMQIFLRKMEINDNNVFREAFFLKI